MCVIRWFLLKSCIFGMYILVTETSVLLQTFDGETTYLKGSTVTLVCTITPYNNEMTWYVDNDAYAGCFLGKCSASANKSYTFTFDFDETAGVFKLNIDSVDSSHAALLFACDDGNVPETISINVTTDNEQNGNERSNSKNGDIAAKVGGGVGAVGGILIAAAVITVVYKKYPKRKEIEKKCNIEPPTLTECTVTSTQVALSWTQPYWNGNASLSYNVVLNQNEPYKTDKTSYTIHDLIPGKAYTVKVYTLCEGLISLPLERTVTTPAVTVSKEDVCLEPAASCVKCNIKWTVRDFVKPQPFKESDKFDYNVICYLGKKIVHASKTIKELNYTVPELHPESSYEICVYAFYHSEKLEPPCKIEIEAPYIPTNLEATAQSTLIDLKWKKPVYTGDQKLDYVVCCNVDKRYKTDKTSYTKHDLIPGKAYTFKVYTLLEELISLPLERTVTTPAVTVSQEDVCFEPAESCVKCNIKWTVRDFVKPKPFKESDKFDYNVICYLGKKIVHASKTIKELNYTVPELHPESSYEICVYAFYHSEKLEPPCKIEIEAPYKPSNLEAYAQSNLIDLEWEKPVYTGDQKLEYEVTCDGVFKGKTNNTTYRIGGCISGKRYEIKIFTIINGIKSLPSVKNVRTQPSQPKELPPLKVGQLKALPMEMSNSVQFVSEEGFAQNHSNRQRRNNAVDHRPDF